VSDFDEGAFRQRIREFVTLYAPALPYRTGTRSPEDANESAVLRAWGAQLYAADYYGADWPVDFGGRVGYDAVEEFLVTEELAKSRTPIPIGSGGLAAHAMIHFGMQQQREAYLPKIRSYEHVWCQLFSEPDAGSDLASMRTTAIRDGDDYVVNGQKVWSTNAFFSDMGYLLARTNPDAAKHAGISAFALDLSSPGITIRPLREMTGTSDFNEVFLDDVRVPASNLIGEENAGWRIATESLASERAGVGALVIRLRQNLDALVDFTRCTPSAIGAGRLADDQVVRQNLAAFTARVEIATLVSQASMRRRLRGEFREMDVPLSKLGFSTLNWDLAEYGLSIQGMRGTLATESPHAESNGRWQDELLYAKAYNISGGSDQIMRNLLAERALGLPREPKAI
jgi:alkylation response protein AidB-like acyl-CoA dehydrogenase